MRNWAREKGCCLGITWNRTGSIFRPNNEYRKQSREGHDISVCDWMPKKVAISESRRVARVAYLGKITNIEMVARENYKWRAIGRVGIIACAIGHATNVAVSESHG